MYLVKSNLPLIGCCALIFLNLSTKKCFFSLLSSFKYKFTSIPFSLNFLSSFLKIIVEALTSWIQFLSRHARLIIDSAISLEHFSEDRLFLPTCKIK